MSSYDVHDNWGNKIGTVRPSSDGGCIGILLGTLLIILVLIGVCGLWIYNTIIYPTKNADYLATSARLSGHTETVRNSGEFSVGNTIPDSAVKLYPGASIEFDVSVPSDNQYHVALSGSVDNPSDDLLATLDGGEIDAFDMFYDNSFVVHLTKGSHSIKLIDKGPSSDGVEVVGLHIEPASG